MVSSVTLEFYLKEGKNIVPCLAFSLSSSDLVDL